MATETLTARCGAASLSGHVRFGRSIPVPIIDFSVQGLFFISTSGTQTEPRTSEHSVSSHEFSRPHELQGGAFQHAKFHRL